jgi:hypothetical protein
MDTEGFEVWKAEKRPTFMPQSHGQGRFIIMCSFVYSTGAISIHFSRSKVNPLIAVVAAKRQRHNSA